MFSVTPLVTLIA